MKRTDNLNLNMPELDDRVNIENLNDNTDSLDKIINNIKLTLNTKTSIHSPKFTGTPVAFKPDGSTYDWNGNHGWEPIATLGSILDFLQVEEITD